MVSIIILSYNTKDLLHACLTSVFKNFHQEDIEVIVVDNASKDTSVEMIKKEFKNVNLIESKENLGFSKGINLGVKSAKGDILLFLNSDTTIKENNLKDIINCFERDKTIGIIGGALYGKDGTRQVYNGSFYTIFNVLFANKSRRDAFPDGNPTETEWVSGGCMFVKKELFEKLSGFDEHFFMYVEDMELCFRAKKLGYKTMFMPSFSVHHIQQGSSNRAFAIVEIYKGIHYFFKKHKNTVEYIIVIIVLIIKALGAILIGTITRNHYLTSTYRKALRALL